MSAKKIILSLAFIAGGILLWLQHMSLVHVTVGKTRTRLGQLFHDDRLYYYILSIKISAVVLILCGVAMALIGWLRSRQKDQVPL